MDSESVLPNDQRLDLFLKECGHEVQLEIEDRQPGDAELIDTNIELADFTSFRYFSRFVEWEVMRINDEASRQAIYRAMAFAYEVAQIVHEANAQFNAAPYIVHIMNSTDREEFLRNDTQDYLAHNPHIHDLIQYYLDDIDQGRQKPMLIEMSAALVFMLVERNLGDIFLHESSRNASIEQLGIE